MHWTKTNDKRRFPVLRTLFNGHTRKLPLGCMREREIIVHYAGKFHKEGAGEEEGEEAEKKKCLKDGDMHDPEAALKGLPLTKSDVI